jgi:hypothetical protein
VFLFLKAKKETAYQEKFQAFSTSAGQQNYILQIIRVSALKFVPQ